MINYGKYFREEEFHCHCGECEFPGMDQEFLYDLNNLREALGQPIIITSGYRCEKYNKKIGGSPTSSHLKGLAVDISCKDSIYRFCLIQTLFWNQVDFILDRIGIAKDFIHLDKDSSKQEDRIWVY